EPREFCLQYRESDLSFISRLMEEEGIYYFFEHTQDKHMMVIGNSPGVHQPCPNAAQVKYRTARGGQHDDAIYHWHVQPEFHSGKCTLSDYYFETPSSDLKVTAASAVSVAGNNKFDVYDYPGAFAKRFDGDDKAAKVRPDGERTVKLRMQGEEAQHKVASGT